MSFLSPFQRASKSPIKKEWTIVKTYTQKCDNCGATREENRLFDIAPLKMGHIPRQAGMGTARCGVFMPPNSMGKAVDYDNARKALKKRQEEDDE